jgi:hypothetical protein
MMETTGVASRDVESGSDDARRAGPAAVTADTHLPSLRQPVNEPEWQSYEGGTEKRETEAEPDVEGRLET